MRITKVKKVEGRLVNILQGFAQASDTWADFVGSGGVEHVVEVYRKLIESGDGVELIAEDDDGNIMGAIAGIKAPDMHSGIMQAIETFWFVHPAYRKSGVGVALLEAFEAWAKEEGCKRVGMTYLVDSHPESLRKLYEYKGYKLVEQHFMKRL